MRWIVTGANRGIGLEFVRQLDARGEDVEAGTRVPLEAKELAVLAGKSGGRVRVHACDVGDDASVRAFASSVGDVPADILINNAGVMGKMASLGELDLEDAARTFNVNALGPIRVTRAFLPLLLKGKGRKVVQITSGMGSIEDNNSGGAYGYRMSKAALNMANKSMSVDFRDRGLVCVVMNPGWVKTDMGGTGAPTPAEESVRLMLGIIDELGPEQSGRFLSFRGNAYAY